VADKLQGKRVAFLATDMVEQVELTEPWKAVEEAGAAPELISLEEGEIQGFNHYDKADMFKVDRTVEEVRADDYDALVIPGASATRTGCERPRTRWSSRADSSSRANR